MRFIVTQNGEHLLKVMEDENINNPSVLAKTWQLNQSSLINHIGKFKHSKSPQRKKYINPVHCRTKSIDIHQKKLNIPKQINEKYNNPDSNDTSSLILPELPKNLNSRNRNYSTNNDYSGSLVHIQSENVNSSNGTGFQLIYSLRNVIQDKTYFNLRHNIQNVVREKEKLGRVDENNFRSIYKEKTDVENVDDLLNNTVLDTGKINLIHYLNSKDNLSQQFIKNLNQADEDKINKINKYCQIIANQKEVNEIRKNIVKNKIKNRYIKDKNDCQELFGGMSNDIDMFKKICSDYERNYNQSKKENYREFHKDIQKKYWSKYNVDLLQRKNNNLVYYNNNSFLENGANNEIKKNK